ncbi:MAG: DUF2269 family protein [Chloroflexi bacterium]|nr:DUF2269 family protein [Chloroflexota bacterium]
MNTEDWYLFGHLAGVFLLLGAGGLTTGTAIAAGRAKAANTVVTLLDLQRRSELYVSSAGAALAVVFGTLLVDKGGFEYGDPWISAAYALLIVVLAVDHGYFMRRNRQIRASAAALGNGEVTADISRQLSDPVLMVVGVLLDVSFIVFLWLMIAKPGG